MSSNKSLGLIVSVWCVALAGAGAYGCSSSDSPTPATGADAAVGGTDSGTQPVADAAQNPSDSAVFPDTSTGDDGGSTACTPSSTTSYTPPTYAAPVANQGLCSSTQIGAFVTACGDNGTNATCDAWMTANVKTDAGAGDACGNCIMAPANNGGVYSDPAGGFNPNYGACIQLTDKTNGAACAAALDHQADCEGIACNSCNSGYSGCLNSADNGSCSSYVTASTSACATDNVDGGAASACSPAGASNAYDPDYTYIITLICGGGDGGVVDGGHD